MHGEWRLKVLEILREAALNAGDLFVAITVAGYGASSKGIDYQMNRLARNREKRKTVAEADEKLRRRYAQMIFVLTRDGLIEKQASNANAHYKLTFKGKRRLVTLRERAAHGLPPPEGYRPMAGKQLIIVAFDIPESGRLKRNWIRLVLKQLGLTMLQRSVWIGKVKIPQKFIEDIHRLELTSFIEIFAITKSGSLQHVS